MIMPSTPSYRNPSPELEEDRPVAEAPAPLAISPTLNVHFSITTMQEGQEVRRLYFHWPVAPVPTPDDFAIMRAIVDIGESGLHGQREVELSEELVERLFELGLVVRETEEMRADDHLDLEVSEESAELVPAYPGDVHLPVSADPDGDLELTYREVERPSELQGEPMFEQATWLEDRISGLALPYPRGTHPGALDEATQLRLGFLAPAAEVLRRRNMLVACFSDRGGAVEAEGFVVVRRFLAPWQVAALRAYTRSCVARGALVCREDQVRGRYQQHNNELFRTIHLQLPRTLRGLFSRPVKASFCNLCLYPFNALLPRHHDRANCTWNVSMVIDGDHEVPREACWPLWLEPPTGGTFDVRLELGDIAVYSGCSTWHYRHPLLTGQRYLTSCSYHFVPLDFEGALD